jgi:hypothetical protein
MPKRAKDGTLLDELVASAIPRCQSAERACPRQGPGRKPEIPDWVLTVMIMVGVMLRKKTKSAQFTWWDQHREEFDRWFPNQRMPARSTFFDRYRRVSRLFQQVIELQGQHAVKCGWADAHCVAVDKSLLKGRGRPWRRRDRQQGYLPRRVDREANWGYSEYHGWVHGYSFEVVVTAPRQGVVWPLIASADTASRSEQKSVLAKIPNLPPTTRYVLADAGYDSNRVGEEVEHQNGKRTGRRFLCPEVPRPNTGRPRQRHSRQSHQRQYHRRLRDLRRQFLRSRIGRTLYARRKTRIEPFNARLKHLFDLNDRVWHWGLGNNRTMVLAAICSYQLLLTHNHRKHRPVEHLKALLDGL